MGIPIYVPSLELGKYIPFPYIGKYMRTSIPYLAIVGVA